MARRDSDMNLSRLAQHPRRHVDEGMAETLPLPTHRLPRQRQLGQPGLQVVGQASTGEKGCVGQQSSRGHPHARDPVLELLDDVLLVTALIGQVDHPPVEVEGGKFVIT